MRAEHLRRDLLSAWLVVATGCHLGTRPEPTAHEPKSAEAPETGPVPKLERPLGYFGPIDPEWPPSHPADLELELRASAILRERMAHGDDAVLAGEPLLKGDTPTVFAEAGHIGGFDYIEVILGEVPSPDVKLPLIVLLHGRGDRPRIPGAPLQQDAPVRVFIPRAPDRLGEQGYTWLATWTLSGDEELLARSLSGRADQLAPAIEAFRRLRPTLHRPILVGFSQGAIMSYALAVRYPARFAAAIPIAGWLPIELVPKTLPKLPSKLSMPYIHAIHGTADEVVPIAYDRVSVRALRARGYEVQMTEAQGVGHVVTQEMGETVRSWLRGGLYPERYPDERPPGLD